MRLFWEEASSFITYGPWGWLKLHKWSSYGSASTYWEKLDSDLLFGLPTYQLWSLKIETNSIQIPILPVTWQMLQNWDKICVLHLLGDPTRTIDICSFGCVVTNFMVHTKWKAMFPTYPITYKIPGFYISLTPPKNCWHVQNPIPTVSIIRRIRVRFSCKNFQPTLQAPTQTIGWTKAPPTGAIVKP